MRTTLTIEDRIAAALKEIAHCTGKSFKTVVNETLHRGLDAAGQRSRAKPYRLRPVSLGGVRPGVDLDKALRLADALADEEIVRKLRMKK